MSDDLDFDAKEKPAVKNEPQAPILASKIAKAEPTPVVKTQEADGNDSEDSLNFE